MKQIKNRQPKKPPKSPQDKILNKPLTKKQRDFIRKSVKKIFRDYGETFRLLGRE
jgi:hypothetical protein